VAFAKTLLAQGSERVKQLANGQAPWLQATGLVVRGYRSKLDDSIQPYGLVVPPDWKAGDRNLRRLDVWLAGRNEKRTELAFLAERESAAGPFNPPRGIVLHPYGRFCNANKFAGEMDVFEAMDAVHAHYPTDPNRLVVGGFSMGGASAWHLATHHASLWSAAAPGAGFAETALFTKAFAAGNEPPPWWEQKLWAWYDATGYAGNLFHCPTIAYNGEIDSQKQAADVMEQAMAREGLKLERYIGPQTGHKYHPETRDKIAARMDALAGQGRDPLPKGQNCGANGRAGSQGQGSASEGNPFHHLYLEIPENGLGANRRAGKALGARRCPGPYRKAGRGEDHHHQRDGPAAFFG
jgi:hypothetical protein